MIVAGFERQDEAIGLRDLLRDVGDIEAEVFEARSGWIVEVLRPFELRAFAIHYLYYIKGVPIEDVPNLPRADRIDVLVQAVARLALESKQWKPPPCDWYAARAELDASDTAEALATARAEYDAHRRSFLRRLFRT